MLSKLDCAKDWQMALTHVMEKMKSVHLRAVSMELKKYDGRWYSYQRRKLTYLMSVLGSPHDKTHKMGVKGKGKGRRNAHLTVNLISPPIPQRRR